MQKKERITSATVTEPEPGLWSNCVRIGNIAYVSGMTSRASDGVAVLGTGEYEQTRIIFTKIRDLIIAAGGSIDDVTKLTIFVTNIKQNKEVWRARREFFQGDFPACSLVEVRALATPQILVEIEAIAHLGASSAK